MNVATEHRTVPAGPKLESLTGIGGASARALRKVGIATAEALAACDHADLAVELAALHHDGHAKTDWSSDAERFVRVAQDTLRSTSPLDHPPTEVAVGESAPPRDASTPPDADVADHPEAMRITPATDTDGDLHWIIHTDVEAPADSNLVVLVVTDDGTPVLTGTASPDPSGSRTVDLPELTTGEYRCFSWIRGPLPDGHYHKPVAGPLIRAVPGADDEPERGPID